MYIEYEIGYPTGLLADPSVNHTGDWSSREARRITPYKDK